MNSASSIPATIHREQPATAASGWLFLVIVVVLIALGLFTIISGVRDESVAMAVAGVLIAIAAMVTCGGFFTLQPNESAVLTLFGAYRSEEHTSELQSLRHLVCRLLLEKKKNK